MQKAFSNLELKDENGNNLITEELKSLFTIEKPIIKYGDLVDENGRLKTGLELFEFSVALSGNLKNFFSVISYNDIPRLVDMFKKLNPKATCPSDLLKGDKLSGELMTPEKRAFFADEILSCTGYKKIFDYHKKQ